MSLEVRSLFGVGEWRAFPSVYRRRFGVSEGGPWDREAARLALVLGGLSENEPVFELLHGTGEMEVSEGCGVCIVGTDGKVEVDGKAYPLGVRLPLERAGVVKVEARCAYIAASNLRTDHAKLDWRPQLPDVLRYLPLGEPREIEVTVSPMSSRAGVRLMGLGPSGQPERPSEPCCIGAIQYTPGGELIVIGPDGPTIGGYPRLGAVINADLDLIPRLRIGQQVRLMPVVWEEARKAERVSLERLAGIVRQLVVVGTG